MPPTANLNAMPNIAPIAPIGPSRSYSASSEPRRMSIGDMEHPQGGPGRNHEESQIPKVTNFTAAIFVPLHHEDITKPREQPRDRVERAKRVLESIEFHRQGVHANLFHLVNHEKRRIVDGVQQYEKHHGPVPNTGVRISPEDADIIIDAMMTPMDPGADYNIDTEGWNMSKEDRGTDEMPTRANAMRQLQRTVERGVAESSYEDEHINIVRQRWLGILEKEERVLEGFGLAQP